MSPSSHSAHSGGKVRVFLQNHQTVNPVMFIEAVFTRAMMALLVVVDCWRICALAIGFYFFFPPKNRMRKRPTTEEARARPLDVRTRSNFLRAGGSHRA